MSPLLISIAVFVAVAALIGGLVYLFLGDSSSNAEERLELLAGLKSASPTREESVLREGALGDFGRGKFLEKMFARFGNLRGLIEQADAHLSPSQFLAICAGFAAMGVAFTFVVKAPVAVIPIAGLIMAVLPYVWLVFKRRKRLKKFAAQLPDALELIARALRAGHSLAAGLSLVAEEMPAPIGVEFGRAFEEQNLGVALDDALKNLTDRVPNLDLKFFATAVVLQRQTGGDLAEILDKIGYIIRERFKIWGQVQALTGEGRLSGIVLLGLPPVLFLVVYYLNPDYSMMLFTDPMGQQMLIGAGILQVLGALTIRKIVNIKV